MTTNAELIAEAKALTPATTASHDKRLSISRGNAAFIDRARELLPQLADALEAVTRELGDIAIEAAAARYQCEAAEARLAKVLPLAIDTIQVVRGGEWVGGKRCRSCHAEWADGYTSQGHAYNEPRTSAPDCPARPMEPGT